MSADPIDPGTCARCGQVHPRGCKGHSRSTGKPCGNRAIAGGFVCHMHGGSSPQARRAAADRLAQQRAAIEMARHGLVTPRAVDPGDALLEAIYGAAGEVDYWRSVVAQLDPSSLTWGKTQQTTKKGKIKVTETAGAAVAYKLMVDAQDRLARYAASALKAGIEERRVRLAESQGAQLAGVVQAVLAGMLAAVVETLQRLGVAEVDLVAAVRDAWSAAVAEVVPREVRRLAIEGGAP